MGVFALQSSFRLTGCFLFFFVVSLLVVMSGIVHGELEEGWSIHNFKREYSLSLAVGAHISGST